MKELELINMSMIDMGRELSMDKNYVGTKEYKLGRSMVKDVFREFKIPMNESTIYAAYIGMTMMKQIQRIMNMEDGKVDIENIIGMAMSVMSYESHRKFEDVNPILKHDNN